MQENVQKKFKESIMSVQIIHKMETKMAKISILLSIPIFSKIMMTNKEQKMSKEFY